MDIGQKIRQLRTQNNLTLEELASRSELTKGFLSQVERNLTSPSVSTLEDILEALGTDLASFLKTARRTRSSLKRRIISWMSMRSIVSTGSYRMRRKMKWSRFLLELSPQGSSKEFDPHDGEEFGYVLQGSISIHLGNRTYKAKKRGNPFYYTSDKTHYLSSRSGASIIWVSSPPSFLIIIHTEEKYEPAIN